MQGFVVLYLALWITLANAQSGGGMGGGGGGSVSTGSGRGSLNSRRNSCDDDCEGKSGSELDSCMSNCESQSQLGGIVAGAVVGGVAFIALVVGGILYWKRDKIKCDCFQKRTRVRIHQQYFESKDNESTHLSQLQNLLNNLLQLSWSMYFVQENKNYVASVEKVEGSLIQENDEIELAIAGKDQFGHWRAKGNVIVNKQHQLSILLFKDYDDAAMAGQVRGWSNLVYKGEYLPQVTQFTGTWYYHGYESDPKYHGKWGMLHA